MKKHLQNYADQFKLTTCAPPSKAKHKTEQYRAQPITHASSLALFFRTSQALIISTLGLVHFPSESSKSSTPSIYVPATQINERNPEQGLTSAPERVIGLTSKDPTKPIRSPRFIIQGINPHHRYICINITGSNNIYNARFAISNPHKGPRLIIAYESKYWDRIRGRLAGEISISAHPSSEPTCRRSAQFLQASWDTESNLTGGQILVSAKRANQVKFQLSEGAAIECTRLSEILTNPKVALVSYTHACPIDFDSINCPNTAKILIQRTYSDESPLPDVIEIIGGCHENN